MRRQSYRNNRRRRINRPKLLLVALLIIILFLWITEVKMEHATELQGADYQELQDKMKLLDTENTELKDKLYTAEAYTTISEKAKQMGYVQKR